MPPQTAADNRHPPPPPAVRGPTPEPRFAEQQTTATAAGFAALNGTLRVLLTRLDANGTLQVTGRPQCGGPRRTEGEGGGELVPAGPNP